MVLERAVDPIIYYVYANNECNLYFQADTKSNATHLICRCNHLTSFGGNFLQAPNPIDFDTVFTEFENLAESGNISVLVTICCAFLLYFVVIVFARRADTRDKSKASYYSLRS